MKEEVLKKLRDMENMFTEIRLSYGSELAGDNKGLTLGINNDGKKEKVKGKLLGMDLAQGHLTNLIKDVEIMDFIEDEDEEFIEDEELSFPEDYLFRRTGQNGIQSMDTFTYLASKLSLRPYFDFQGNVFFYNSDGVREKEVRRIHLNPMYDPNSNILFVRFHEPNKRIDYFGEDLLIKDVYLDIANKLDLDVRIINKYVEGELFKLYCFYEEEDK